MIPSDTAALCFIVSLHGQIYWRPLYYKTEITKGTKAYMQFGKALNKPK